MHGVVPPLDGRFRVGVSLLWLVPGVVGGSEEYTLRLLRAIHQIQPPDLEVLVYCRPDLITAHPDVPEMFQTEAHDSRNKLARVGAEYTWLAKRNSQNHLFHQPGSVLPLGAFQPSIFTVHDLQPLEMPQNFGFVKRNWHRQMLPRSIDDATRIVTPSQFTANRVADLLDKDPDDIDVVLHGHEPTQPGPADPEAEARLRERFGRFILYPAIAYVHKRHCDLLDALDSFGPELADVSVVFTGHPGPMVPALRDHAQVLGLNRTFREDRVHFLGRVASEELDHLYRAASAVAIPSEYEGFGNPSLEAMARGVPTVVTSAGALPEVVGDAALVVPSRDPRALADALQGVLTDARVEERLRSAGPKRAQNFGWKNAGESLLGSYRRALMSSGVVV